MAAVAPKEGSGAKKATPLPSKQTLLPGEERKLKKRGKGKRSLLSEAATKASAGVMRAFLSSAPPPPRPVPDSSEDSVEDSDDLDAFSSSDASASAAAAPRSRRPRSDISWRVLLGGLPATVRRPHSVGELPAYDDEEDDGFDHFTLAK